MTNSFYYWVKYDMIILIGGIINLRKIIVCLNIDYMRFYGKEKAT